MQKDVRERRRSHHGPQNGEADLRDTHPRERRPRAPREGGAEPSDRHATPRQDRAEAQPNRAEAQPNGWKLGRPRHEADPISHECYPHCQRFETRLRARGEPFENEPAREKHETHGCPWRRLEKSQIRSAHDGEEQKTGQRRGRCHEGQRSRSQVGERRRFETEKDPYDVPGRDGEYERRGGRKTSRPR